MPALIAITCGYAALIWLFGWQGVAAIAVHLLIMLWPLRKSKKEGNS